MKKISLRGKQFAVTKISVHQHDLQPIAVIYLLPGKLLDPSQTNRTPNDKEHVTNQGLNHIECHS